VVVPSLQAFGSTRGNRKLFPVSPSSGRLRLRIEGQVQVKVITTLVDGQMLCIRHML
jgi:hypothetical protein